MSRTAKPLPLAARQERWRHLGGIARRLIDEIDVYDMIEAAGEEIWRSMQWWGRPDSRGDHVRTCTCGECS